MSFRVSFVTDLDGLKHVDSNIIRLRRQVREIIKNISELTDVDYKEIRADKLPDHNLFEFINSEILIIDYCDKEYQNEINYNLGTRDSFGKSNTIIFLEPLTEKSGSSAKDGILILPLENNSKFHHLKYFTYENELFYNDSKLSSSQYELNQNDHITEDSNRIIEFFEDLLTNKSPENNTHNLINELEKLREENNYSKIGLFLQKLIHKDPPTPEIIFNVLIIFRDCSIPNNYDYMIKLCDHVQKCWDGIKDQNILYQYAFALNRRNSERDRDKALQIIDKLSLNSNSPPDTFGLLGRIYKDKYYDEKNPEYLKKAINAYRTGFERHQSEYLGINLASLLDIEDRTVNRSEIEQICTTITQRLGRKGQLSKLDDYWSAAIFFETSILTYDFKNANKSAERMYKLYNANPKSWMLQSTLKNVKMIMLNRQFPRHNLDYKVFTAWHSFFYESVNGDDDESKSRTENDGPDADGDIVFTVLYMYDGDPHPASLQINLNVDDQNFHLRTYDYSIMTETENVDPMLSPSGEKSEMIQLHRHTNNIHSHEYHPVDAVIHTEEVTGLVFSKKNPNDIFIYTLKFGIFFHIQFSSENSRSKFADLTRKLHVLADACQENQENLKFEYEYERDNEGQRICLGQGSFGKVFAGLSDKYGPIAIKEFINVTKNIQPIREEILLHSRLSHRNIVIYLGAALEDNVFKIFMERVSGDTLTKISRSFKEFPEKSCSIYSGQILEGIKYLHKNRIIHRDIKSQNILVDKYTGIVKITDFGESQTYGIFEVKDKIFVGTTRYMAPEILFDKKWSYSADIWSFGCTVVEMITGKLPYHEYADVPLFKIGKYRMTPTIPTTVSEQLKDFLDLCFESTPEKRADARRLLQHKFIMMYNQPLPKIQKYSSLPVRKRKIKRSSLTISDQGSLFNNNNNTRVNSEQPKEKIHTPEPQKGTSSWADKMIPELPTSSSPVPSVILRYSNDPARRSYQNSPLESITNVQDSPTTPQQSMSNDGNSLVLNLKNTLKKFSKIIRKHSNSLVNNWHEFSLKRRIELPKFSQTGLDLSNEDVVFTVDSKQNINLEHCMIYSMETFQSDVLLKTYIEKWFLKILVEIIADTMAYNSNYTQDHSKDISPFRMALEILKYENDVLNPSGSFKPSEGDPFSKYKIDNVWCSSYRKLIRLIMKLHKNQESLDGVKMHIFKPNQFNKYHFDILTLFTEIIPKDEFLPHEYTTLVQIISDDYILQMHEIFKKITQISHRDKKNDLRRTKTFGQHNDRVIYEQSGIFDVSPESRNIPRCLTLDTKENLVERPASLYQDFGLNRLSMHSKLQDFPIQEDAEVTNPGEQPQQPELRKRQRSLKNFRNNSKELDNVDEEPSITQDTSIKNEELLKSINNLVDRLDNLSQNMSEFSEILNKTQGITCQDRLKRLRRNWSSNRSKKIDQEMLPSSLAELYTRVDIPAKDRTILDEHIGEYFGQEFILNIEREDLWKMKLSCISVVKIWNYFQSICHS